MRRPGYGSFEAISVWTHICVIRPGSNLFISAGDNRAWGSIGDEEVVSKPNTTTDNGLFITADLPTQAGVIGVTEPICSDHEEIGVIVNNAGE